MQMMMTYTSQDRQYDTDSSTKVHYPSRAFELIKAAEESGEFAFS